MEQGYYRYPTVRGATVVFVAEDDLWTVPLAGGVARRLTTGLGSATRPQLSPDGQWIAFVGKEEGDSEVYLMPSEGGPARRLTYLASGAMVVGWHPDGRIVFSSYYGHPFLAWRSLYAVSPEGEEPEPLPYGRASWISFGPDRGVVLGRPTTDSAYWKRYRGGTRGVLWIDADGTGSFRKFALDDGNVVNPLWIGDRIYFISDHEDHANIYSILPDGSDLRRHTDHAEYYVRHASTDGRTLVYQSGGDLYRLDLSTDTVEKIAVAFYSQGVQRALKHVDAREFWSEYTLSPSGSTLLVTTRGKLFQCAPFEGPVRQRGTLQGVRYRKSVLLNDDGRLATISDEDGEDRIELRTADTPELVQRLSFDVGIVTEMVPSPDGQWLAVANERQQLWLINLSSYDTHLVAETIHGHIQGFDWAPDSRWLAYALPGPMATPLYLYNVETQVSHQITDPILADRQPVFDPEGRYLYFLSQRVFKPVWDSMKFDLGFPKGDIPCLITLAADTPSPFLPAPRPVVAEDAKEPQPSDQPPTTRIDLDHIRERVLAFPVAESRYGQLAAGPRVVYWTRREPTSDLSDGLSSGPPQAEWQLVRYDLTNLKEETLHEHVTSFRLSASRRVMAVRLGQQLRVIKAGEKIEGKDEKPGRETGIVDFSRFPVVVEPLAEWYQMQREAWRWMREMFWTPDMADVDWDEVYQRYRQLLPRIRTRSEFSDLMWEMQGELGSSHAYEYGGDYRTEPQHKVGFLGARYRWNDAANGYEITHIIQGDSADPARTSPLLTPGANIAAGDIITAINGQPLGPDRPPGARLLDLANHPVSVTVTTQGGESRTVTVKPLASELPARYREWVDDNRRYVHERTQGRVGYIHIPNMGVQGFAEFHRGYLTEYLRDGLIIDVRYNGGGIVSPLLLEVLQRRRIAFARLRHGHLEPYPYQSPAGPMVAITNEHAGSDGDIFSHAFKLMRLGPLIGVRTWGGVIGINPRYALVDWGTTSQPEDAFWFQDVGLAVENYGTDPDIVVEETPQGQAQGIDEQLERAIEEIQRLVETFTPLTPDFAQRPSRRPRPLPPRPRR
ncbi:MAG: PDZ domain-containing protein [Firmicutes bacterium]|nr:PDZ domain-containing protein [Bacillota bacterium]